VFLSLWFQSYVFLSFSLCLETWTKQNTILLLGFCHCRYCKSDHLTIVYIELNSISNSIASNGYLSPWTIFFFFYELARNIYVQIGWKSTLTPDAYWTHKKASWSCYTISWTKEKECTWSRENVEFCVLWCKSYTHKHI
jgi:hypothetical protein